MFQQRALTPLLPPMCVLTTPTQSFTDVTPANHHIGCISLCGAKIHKMQTTNVLACDDFQIFHSDRICFFDIFYTFLQVALLTWRETDTIVTSGGWES